MKKCSFAVHLMEPMTIGAYVVIKPRLCLCKNLLTTSRALHLTQLPSASPYHGRPTWASVGLLIPSISPTQGCQFVLDRFQPGLAIIKTSDVAICGLWFCGSVGHGPLKPAKNPSGWLLRLPWRVGSVSVFRLPNGAYHMRSRCWRPYHGILPCH